MFQGITDLFYQYAPTNVSTSGGSQGQAFAILIIGGLVVLVGFLLFSFLNQSIFFRKRHSSVSRLSTYEFRNKVKQPFFEQDI
jgi:hypothetical protein